MMGIDDVPQRNDRVVFRPLAYGDAVLLHLDSGAYHGLNETGAAVWELIDGNRNVDTIVHEVRDGLDEVPADIDEVIRGFLAALDERELVAFPNRP